MSGRDLVNEMREGGQVPRAPTPRGGLFDLLLAIVIVVAVGSIGYFGVTYWLSPGAPKPSATPPQFTAAAVSSRTDLSWTDADTALCQSRARAAVNEPLPPQFGLANPAVTEGFSGLATMVDCSLTTKVARFCDPTEKAAMIAMINDYLRRVDIVQIGLGLQGAPMAMMGGLFGGETAFGSDMYDEVRTETLQFMAGYHKQIAADLQALARDGIVAPSDFGGPLGLGVPKNIQTMFGGVEPERHACG